MTDDEAIERLNNMLANAIEERDRLLRGAIQEWAEAVYADEVEQSNERLRMQVNYLKDRVKEESERAMAIDAKLHHIEKVLSGDIDPVSIEEMRALKDG